MALQLGEDSPGQRSGWREKSITEAAAIYKGQLIAEVVSAGFCLWPFGATRGLPDNRSFIQPSMPPRNTNTRAGPAWESISAALAERSSERQIVTIGPGEFLLSSGSLWGSCASGMLIDPLT